MAVARVNQHHGVVLGADLHGRPQPFQRAIGTIAMHVGMQLDHLEAIFLDMELQFRRPVFRAPARIEGKAADKAIGPSLDEFDHIRHIVTNTLATTAIAIAIARIAGWRLDKAHVDTTWFAVDHIGTIQQRNHAFAGEWRPRMAPGLVHQIGGMQMSVDNHLYTPFDKQLVVRQPA